jgi:polysaccharide export outer membrane protein
MAKRISLGAALAVISLAGCAHHAQPVPVSNVDEPFRIGREDVLDIAVWRDADLSRTLPVRPDGFISMPMVGEIQAEGKTPAELSEEIKTRLAPYIQQPRVTVMVHEVNSARIFVTGEVAHPGAFPMKGRISVVQAIALAGGFSDFANKDGILVIRQGQGQEGAEIPVRYSDMVADNNNRRDLFLKPGDTVVVP